MSKDFKIAGNTTEEKLKALETIIPRMLRKREIVKEIKAAPAIINFYSKESQGVLFKYLLFKGSLIKVAYNIEAADKDTLISQDKVHNDVRFNCSILSGSTYHTQKIETKKLSDIIDLGLKVSDGDILIVEGAESDIIFKNISISILLMCSPANQQFQIEEISNEDI